MQYLCTHYSSDTVRVTFFSLFNKGRIRSGHDYITRFSYAVSVTHDRRVTTLLIQCVWGGARAD